MHEGNGQIDGWMNGQTDDGSMDGQEMDRWLDGWLYCWLHSSIDHGKVADPISYCHLLTHPPLIDSCCRPFVGVARHLHPCTVSVICADTVDLLSLFLCARAALVTFFVDLSCSFFPAHLFLRFLEPHTDTAITHLKWQTS